MRNAARDWLIWAAVRKKFERLVKNRVAQEMMVQNVSLEKDLAQKQADITYLQNQINPHFLYNTLECIRGQALNEGMDDLADTVKALALFFRYNISVKGTVVSFEEELKNLENYISIQQYRFKNKFTMHVDIEPEEKKQILACRLPKLCLQPLVEKCDPARVQRDHDRWESDIEGVLHRRKFKHCGGG